jgi:hypothetical protein
MFVVPDYRMLARDKKTNNPVILLINKEKLVGVV